MIEVKLRDLSPWLGWELVAVRGFERNGQQWVRFQTSDGTWREVAGTMDEVFNRLVPFVSVSYGRSN